MEFHEFGKLVKNCFLSVNLRVVRNQIAYTKLPERIDVCEIRLCLDSGFAIVV